MLNKKFLKLNHYSSRRMIAYMHKEALQVIRDPSSILIAIVLPLIMIFLFAYGVSLDTNTIKIGLVQEDTSPIANSLADAFKHTPFFNVTSNSTRQELLDGMVAGKLRGVVIIPQDFAREILKQGYADLQVLADGSETNTASFVQNYAQGVLANWLTSQALQENLLPPVNLEPRVWFNPELKSANTLLPGSMSVIMSMIGCLLTALVVAREWERGTMEGMMATPIRVYEMLIAKLIPYFILGIISMLLCVFVSIFLFSVPFRGSILVLILSTAVFLIAALGQGLLISTIARSQFVASQIALVTGFLPAFILSGFLFEIQSMPWIIRLLTYILPPRYFVSILQTLFAAGTIWPLIIPNLIAMLVIGISLMLITAKRSVKRLA